VVPLGGDVGRDPRELTDLVARRRERDGSAGRGEPPGGAVEQCAYSVAMPAAEDRGPVERAERWALMEWILVRRRLLIVLIVLLAIVIATGVALLDDAGIARLGKNGQDTYAHRQSLYNENGAEAPLFGRVPSER